MTAMMITMSATVHNNAPSKISVLCVDDNQHLAEALRIKFSGSQEFAWLGWLADASHMLDKVSQGPPAVVILDIDMPGPDPFESVTRLAERSPDSRVVFFSGHVRRDLIDRGIEAGAWGYVSKNDGEEAIMDAVRRINNGEFVLSPEARTIYER